MSPGRRKIVCQRYMIVKSASRKDCGGGRYWRHSWGRNHAFISSHCWNLVSEMTRRESIIPRKPCLSFRHEPNCRVSARHCLQIFGELDP